MKTIKKLSKYLTLISFVLFSIAEFLDFLFQDIIYNHYVDLDLSCNTANNYWYIGKKYKKIGDGFNMIAKDILDVFIILLIVYLIILLLDFIKTKIKNH